MTSFAARCRRPSKGRQGKQLVVMLFPRGPRLFGSGNVQRKGAAGLGKNKNLHRNSVRLIRSSEEIARRQRHGLQRAVLASSKDRYEWKT